MFRGHLQLLFATAEMSLSNRATSSLGNSHAVEQKLDELLSIARAGGGVKSTKCSQELLSPKLRPSAEMLTPEITPGNVGRAASLCVESSSDGGSMSSDLAKKAIMAEVASAISVRLPFSSTIDSGGQSQTAKAPESPATADAALIPSLKQDMDSAAQNGGENEKPVLPRTVCLFGCREPGRVKVYEERKRTV